MTSSFPLAYRIAAHVARSIDAGARTDKAPTANLFDEMWEIKDEYPFIFKVLQQPVAKVQGKLNNHISDTRFRRH